MEKGKGKAPAGNAPLSSKRGRHETKDGDGGGKNARPRTIVQPLQCPRKKLCRDFLDSLNLDNEAYFNAEQDRCFFQRCAVIFQMCWNKTASMELRHTPGTTINFLCWHIYRIFPVWIFQVLSSWSIFFGWRFFFGCSSSSSSSLLSTLKIVTRQKVGRSTVTRTWQTLVCKKYFESRVFVENWKWVSKGCGSYLIHPGKPLTFPPL